MRKQYKWQKEAFAWAKDLKVFLLKVCCGGGKSLAAILVALHKALPVIIIAPKTICDTWVNELRGCGVDDKDVFVYDRPTHTKLGLAYEKEFEQWMVS